LLRQLAQHEDLPAALERSLSELADMSDSPASGVAIHYAGVQFGLGVLPSHTEVEVMLGWARETFPDQELYVDHQLSQYYEPAQAWQTMASGVMIMWINREQQEAIVWFRPEVATTVTWAGEPRKAVSQGAGNSLQPRSSFAAWKEIVRGNAVSWKAVEIAAMV